MVDARETDSNASALPPSQVTDGPFICSPRGSEARRLQRARILMIHHRLIAIEILLQSIGTTLRKNRSMWF
jgi:hypothetical protein